LEPVFGSHPEASLIINLPIVYRNSCNTHDVFFLGELRRVLKPVSAYFSAEFSQYIQHPLSHPTSSRKWKS